MAVFVDSVGSKDLTIPNTSLWTPDATALPNGDTGYSILSGGSAYVSDTGGIFLPASNPSGDSGLTIEICFKSAQASPNPTQVGWLARHGDSPDVATSRNWGLWWQYERFVSDYYLFYYYTNTGAVAWSYSVQISSNPTPWMHLVFTFVQTNNTSIKGRHWRDGTLMQEYAAPVSTVARRINGTTRLTVMDGYVSGVRSIAKLAIYPYEFVQTDVDAHYAALAYS